MGHRSRAVERRLVSLERKPIRLCWTICAAFAVPVLDLTRLLRHRSGLAIVLAPVLFVIVLFVIGIAGVNLGIVAP